jgi:hypothetical protein
LSRSIVINQTEIQPGEYARLEVNIARLPSHSPIDISITISRAAEDGPVLLLMGGLHGDEINGVEIVRRIIERELHHPLRGSVICIPILNVYGFIHFSRYVPDGKDVNRSFPGSKNGSLASRLAHYLTKEILPQIDMGIDFHTGGADRFNYPQTRCLLQNKKNAEMAEAFAAPFIMNSKFRPKSLRQTASKLGKSILVYEGGESSRFSEDAIEEGISGAVRLMHHFGMRDNPEGQNQRTVWIRKTRWVRARYSGIFQCHITNGSLVGKNQLLGYITDPFGEFKAPIKSPVLGYVISLNANPLLHQGDAVIHLGIPE